MEINAIKNMELFLCCFKHTAITLHITVPKTKLKAERPTNKQQLKVCAVKALDFLNSSIKSFDKPLEYIN